MPNFTYAKGWRVTIVLVLTLLLMLVFPFSQALAANIPHEVTNVGDKSFTVTWVTGTAETGYVNYGTTADSLDNTAYDDRGEATEDDTHHISIIGLTAATLYYYEIISGGVTYNNSGAPYEITTGPDLELPLMPNLISGKVYKTDGATPVEGAIIYASIGTSQVLSALVDDKGTWALNIAPIRAADYQSYYTYSDSDDITIEAKGCADGTTTQTVTIATAEDGAPDMTLEEMASSPSSLAPASFTTSNLTIIPTEVSIGENIAIRVLLANTGDLGGTYKVTLKIDDAVIESKEVTLAGGLSEWTTFTTFKDTAGTYTVAVDGLSQAFMVKPAAPEETEPLKEMNRWLIGGIVAGVIVLAVTIWQINKRRY